MLLYKRILDIVLPKKTIKHFCNRPILIFKGKNDIPSEWSQKLLELAEQQWKENQDF
jgi:hypothetical protein